MLPVLMWKRKQSRNQLSHICVLIVKLRSVMSEMGPWPSEGQERESTILTCGQVLVPTAVLSDGERF